MATPFKVFFTIFAVFIVGLTVYFGYIYFFYPTNSSVNETTSDLMSRASEYQGEIFCIHDTEKGASLAACENFGFLMSDNKSYELVLKSGVKATGYIEGARVRVSGVLTPGASPLGLDGTLTVVKLRK